MRGAGDGCFNCAEQTASAKRSSLLSKRSTLSTFGTHGSQPHAGGSRSTGGRGGGGGGGATIIIIKGNAYFPSPPPRGENPLPVRFRSSSPVSSLSPLSVRPANSDGIFVIQYIYMCVCVSAEAAV